MRTDTKTIVVTMAFMIGVKKSTLYTVYAAENGELLAQLEKSKEALTIRYLCKLRTTLMQKFKKTDNAISYDFKNINSLEWYDSDNIKQLEQWGYTIILANKRAADYTVHFNTLIHDNINQCRSLFPDWINWDYIKDLFVIPKYQSSQHLKFEFEKYMDKIVIYPFQMYIHWKPKDVGNLLSSDGKFLEYIYSSNGDYFGDRSKYRDAVDDVKNNIYDFIDSSYKTVIAVDCENSDVYKLYGMLKNLNREEIDKIEKIILFDDDHTNNGWDHLEKFINIPVEHIEVTRVVDHKSIVDIRMAAGICREFYVNDVTSFMLLSSDSDYWGLISSLKEAAFLVVIEYEKCGSAIKETLDRNGTYYCSLDDFCTGNIDEFKRAVLISELNSLLPDLLSYNGKQLAYKLYEVARIPADENEIMNFYNKYIKTIRLTVDDNGNFSFEIKT
ncbi:MAG: NYN domain-containing protein [Ruminococcus sp.]|nr:NYN domain-containing protein [Ruminococcus sp.]